jgi:hypothetical protein
MTNAIPAPPKWEVADVIRRHGEAFLSRHGSHLTTVKKRTLRDLAVCRTAALGGHVAHCLDCGRDRIAYNSCRNRHCPKCQALTRARWLQKEAANLLPVEYFHVVFTLPAEIADLALANPGTLYDMLLRVAAATLAAVAANPKRLGAMVGALLVLHTWGQNLHHHPHVHAVVTGGGLSCNPRGQLDDTPKWVGCRPGFFLPVRILSRLFRGRYLDELRKAFDAGKLVFPDRMSVLRNRRSFDDWIAALQAREWVVYAKRPFSGPEQVLKYLARYTHRVAISNSRLLDVNEDVTFRYKDYSDDHRQKTMTMTGVEFLRRFVQHVLPKGFVKVRHYGLLANREREDRLVLCRQLLMVETVRTQLPATTTDQPPAPEPACCPHCGSHRLVVRELPRESDSTSHPDTS